MDVCNNDKKINKVNIDYNYYANIIINAFRKYIKLQKKILLTEETSA